MSTFRPDHNGECLNCDEWLDAHGPGGECPTDEAQALANMGRREQLREDASSIICPFCGFVSFNPNDIRERYCGGCHRFQEPEKP